MAEIARLALILHNFLFMSPTKGEWQVHAWIDDLLLLSRLIPFRGFTPKGT